MHSHAAARTPVGFTVTYHSSDQPNPAGTTIGRSHGEQTVTILRDDLLNDPAFDPQRAAALKRAQDALAGTQMPGWRLVTWNGMNYCEGDVRRQQARCRIEIYRLYQFTADPVIEIIALDNKLLPDCPDGISQADRLPDYEAGDPERDPRMRAHGAAPAGRIVTRPAQNAAPSATATPTAMPRAPLIDASLHVPQLTWSRHIADIRWPPRSPRRPPGVHEDSRDRNECGGASTGLP